MILSLEKFRETLDANRGLTIRTLQAFPEDKLFTYSPVEPLRPFSEMILEVLDVERGYTRGIALGDWEYTQPYAGVSSKADLLKACQETQESVRNWWHEITEERLAVVEKDPFFGGEMSHFDRLQYALENEIHHRGQGYIYLRLLGIEPPFFYER
ncbi:putative damage-inducible protein DinB [Pullulanibacillus pueri]|uniref:DNA damage-inducible protein DinB n=1 Tax=Pullulanibacillus pueri TaxID=1437324 RepID=A0A8J3EK68_9BACL|nr:DinB family protein [Pullulanibacillus pueri]MBM7680142.1 putative damage-inducible protein DinB [Pullulanibacillus pueri]GGH74554.1 DNA damage-inducible protein DinB [Pullulanibacillus pueri]